MGGSKEDDVSPHGKVGLNINFEVFNGKKCDWEN